MDDNYNEKDKGWMINYLREDEGRMINYHEEEEGWMIITMRRIKGG